MTAMKLHRYPSPSGGVALGKMGCTDLFHRITAKDYVQDGLVAMWDGIENAGWGVHNPNAIAPVNLATGLTDSFSRENSSVSFTWGENFLSYSGGWIQFTNLNSAISTALQTNYKTYQFVGDFQPTNASEWPPSADIWSQNGSNQCAFQYRQGTRLAYWDYNYASVDWDQYAPTVVRDGNSFLYYDKGKFSRTTTGSNENYRPNISIRCGKITSGTFKVHCIRLYSRALTADEIARNYAIDKARFNLPDIS